MPSDNTPQWKLRRAVMFFKDDKQTKHIARALNISKRTVRRWRNDYKNDKDSFYNTFDENKELSSPILGLIKKYDESS